MSDLGWKYLTAADKEQILRGISDGRAYGGPYNVEIHPADRCNIDCFFCSTAAVRGTDEFPLSRAEELLQELKELGTRSVRFSGGGEPLFHRQTRRFLEAIASSGIPLEHVTTNGVLLTEPVAELLVRSCDTITVSLNTADAASYSSMMQTPERNFERVLTNVRKLIALRRAAGSRRPRVRIQFLVWKENYRSIPRMYELALELGAESILFNGLAFLRPDQQMTVTETAEMLSLYESIVRDDEYRRIENIESFEQDLTPALAAMNARLSSARSAQPVWQRWYRQLKRKDLSFRDVVRHSVEFRRKQRVAAQTAGLADECLIGWYALVVRTDGSVAPCCMLQAARLGNVYKQSVADVWHGPAYEQFRRELTRIIRERETWQHDAQQDQTVQSVCGAQSMGCPVRNFYYGSDVRFRRAFTGRRDELA